ncbi:MULTISPECIES: hypothetical protein [unclassified Streptomyces]|uniref:hypothetical protein n=1 Tax=unclassified Streptomyces TaxID=2593676 RepID=UPI000B8512A1|nr:MULTISPECIES: hypothetical protein [unclassified Streptomyces]
MASVTEFLPYEELKCVELLGCEMSLLKRAVLAALISPHASDTGHVYAQFGHFLSGSLIFGILASVQGRTRVSITPSR